MQEQKINERQTKYCHSIKCYLERVGHATNLDILDNIRLHYPSVSATTIHRATTRLASRGKIKLAPSDNSGSLRYDNNTQEHDHFMCCGCGMLKDIKIPREVLKTIESSLVDCYISGSITISGMCKKCKIRSLVI